MTLCSFFVAAHCSIHIPGGHQNLPAWQTSLEGRKRALCACEVSTLLLTLSPSLIYGIRTVGLLNGWTELMFHCCQQRPGPVTGQVSKGPRCYTSTISTCCSSCIVLLLSAAVHTVHRVSPLLLECTLRRVSCGMESVMHVTHQLRSTEMACDSVHMTLWQHMLPQHCCSGAATVSTVLLIQAQPCSGLLTLEREYME